MFGMDCKDPIFSIGLCYYKIFEDRSPALLCNARKGLHAELSVTSEIDIVGGRWAVSLATSFT